MRQALVGVVGFALLVASVLVGLSLFQVPQDQAAATERVVLDCSDVIDRDVLGRLRWEDRKASRPDRDRRCEWVGQQGSIRVGVTTPARPLSALSERCGRLAADLEDLRRSTTWLRTDEIDTGCSSREERGLGTYTVLAQVESMLVLVEVDLTDKRPHAAVRDAVVALILNGRRAALAS